MPRLRLSGPVLLGMAYFEFDAVMTLGDFLIRNSGPHTHRRLYEASIALGFAFHSFRKLFWTLQVVGKTCTECWLTS